MSRWTNMVAAAAAFLGVPQRELTRPDRYKDWRVPMVADTAITPALISGALREARAGYPHRQAALFQEALGKTGRLAGNLGTRCKSVAAKDWTLTPASTDAADVAIVDWLEPHLKRLDLASSLRRLAEGVAYGYAAEQIHWHQNASDALVVSLTHWPTRFLRPDLDGNMTRITSIADADGKPMEPAQFVVHQPGELGADPATSGLMRSAVWFWFFKNFCLKAWVLYAEKYGQPFRVGKYGPGASKEDKDEAFQALVRMGAETVAMLPESFQVELIQAGGQAAGGGGEVFDKLATRCDAEMTILVLGQTLTTSVGSGGGALATASVHQGIRQELLEWDGRQLSRTMTDQLIAPWVRFQFGEDVGIPTLELQTMAPADLKVDAQVWKGLIVEAGLPVATSDVYEHFGIPAPEDDAVLMVPPFAGKRAQGEPTGMTPVELRQIGPQLSRVDVARVASTVRARNDLPPGLDQSQWGVVRRMFAMLQDGETP